LSILSFMLDIRTLLIVFVATQACLGVIMVIFWRLQKTYPGFRFWASSRVVAAGAFALLGLRGIIPDNLSILLGNLLAVVFTLLGLEGIRFFTGAKTIWKPNLAIISIAGIVFTYFTLVQNNELARTLIVDTFFIGYLLASSWIMLKHSQRTNNALHRVIGFLFLPYAMGILVRGLIMLAVPQNRGLYNETMVNSIGMLFALMTEVSLTLFYLMLNSSRLEEELRQSQLKNEEALNIAKMSYWEYDPSTEIFTFNDRYYQMHGITAQQAGGYQMHAREYATRFIQPAFILPMRDVLLQAERSSDAAPQHPSEGCLLRSNGQPFWVTTWFYPEKDAEGRTIKLYGVSQDITERKQADDVLRNTQKFADLGTLAAGVAHELNSPLQVITGSSDSLLKTLEQNGQIEPQKLSRYLGNISRNSWRMAEIVRSLNTYARPTHDHSDIYTINDLVQDTLLLIEHQLNAWSNIQVELNLTEDTPPFYCNRNDITQVLINLMTNARDSMPQGGKISIFSAYKEEDDEVILEVKDNGAGIPLEIRPRIFDPFFTTKEMGIGTGLGLSIVHSIVSNYGGRIEVESQLQKGTTFRIYFPCRNGRHPKAE
jgi:signal transduction histidine kinase